MNDYEIKKLYEQMEIHLIDSMKRNLGRHLNEEKEVGFKFTQWQAEKLKELKRYQRENKKIIGRYTLGLDKEVSEHLQNELKQGSINAIKQYNQALGKSLKPDKVMNKSFFKTNDKKVNNLIKVVNNDLKTANTSALRMINDQYRQIIHKSAFFVGNGVFTEKQAAAQAVKEISQKKLTTLAIDESSKNFLAGGLNCIEYSDGRRVNIASYAQMAIRTASIRSQLMGEGDFRKSIGRTLVKVTTHGGACPLCVKWQGQILIDDVYSGGTSKDGKYTLLSTAMKQGFLHPNCRHGITTYYPELEDDEEEKVEPTIEQEETQQRLNYAIRNVKKYRRLERGSLAKDNIERYSLKRKEWTKEAHQLSEVVKNNEQTFKANNSINEINKPKEKNGIISKEVLDKLSQERLKYIKKYMPEEYEMYKKFYENGNDLIPINLDGVDEELIEPIIKQYTKLSEEYYNGGLSLSYEIDLKHKDAAGVTKPIEAAKSSQVKLLNYFADKKDLYAYYDKGIKQGWLTDFGGNYDVATITHEFAHSIINGTIGDKKILEEIDAIKTRYKKEINSLERKKDQLTLEFMFNTSNRSAWDEAMKIQEEINKKFISKYAIEEVDRVDEFIAESFVNAKLSKNPSPYAKEVLDIIDKNFRK